jgi:hypothetical protein
MYDKNHQSTSHDLLDVPIRPIISSKAKSIKDPFNRLTQNIWALFSTRLANSTCFPTYT